MSQTPTATPPPAESPAGPDTVSPAKRLGPGGPAQSTPVLRVVLSVLLGAGVLVAGVGIYAYLASLEKPPEAREAVEQVYVVGVFDVERADLREVICGFGTARADREVVVAAQVAGEVVEVHPQLKIGRAVEPVGESQAAPGDLLARIDPKTYIERVQQAERRIAESRAELDRLGKEEENNKVQIEDARKDVEIYKAEYERLQELLKKRVASESDVTRARLELQRYESTLRNFENAARLFPFQYEQVERRIETHQADLEMARLELKRTEVRPPFPGVLSDVMVELGQYVGPGESLVRLTDISKVEVPVALTLKQYAAIEAAVHNGNYPEVRLAENETGEPRWSGQVVRVAPIADELTRTVEVFVQVDNDNQPEPLLAGAFVHARIDGPVLESVTVVPRDALADGRLFVTNSDLLETRPADESTGAPERIVGTVEERSVKVLRTLQSLALIEGDVEPGEFVILTNLDAIHSGAKVRIESHRALSDEIGSQRVPSARQLVAETAGDDDLR